jgi:hypothetical protein
LTDSNAPNEKCDAEIERLEGRPPFVGLVPQSLEVKMWKRSYLVALYAADMIRKQRDEARRISGPMVFFYPEPGD